MSVYRAVLFLSLALSVSADAVSAEVRDKCTGDCVRQTAAETAAPSPAIPHVADQVSATAITATGAPFMFVFGAGGLLRLNLTNGGVQFCALTITNGQPTSACAKIATLPPASLSGNTQFT